MLTYILHVESGLRLTHSERFGFERECKAMAIILHEQKGLTAAPATYTFKLMQYDSAADEEVYTGQVAQYLVSAKTTLQAVPVPRGEGE